MLVGALCAALLTVVVGLLPADTYRSRVRKLQDINRRKAAVSKEMGQVEKARVTTQGQLGRVEQNIRVARADLVQAQQQLQQARKQLAVAKAKYRESVARFERHRQAFQERVLEIYVDGGQVAYLEVLLNATDFFDLANRAYLCQQLIEADQDLFLRFKQEKQKCEEQKRDCEAKERQATALEKRVVQKKFELEVAAKRQRQILQDLGQERQRLAREYDLLEQEAHHVEAMIRQMMGTPQWARLAARKWSGRLIMPCQGTITSYFGSRMHPILRYRRMHYGIDISAPYGSSIIAAGGGVVVYAGYRGGYGKTVMIHHGGQVLTLYAHCSSILVSEGQEVQGGQLVARVGSTGLSTGNHLHFEVRINGRAVNPLGY